MSSEIILVVFDVRIVLVASMLLRVFLFVLVAVALGIGVLVIVNDLSCCHRCSYCTSCCSVPYSAFCVVLLCLPLATLSI